MSDIRLFGRASPLLYEGDDNEKDKEPYEIVTLLNIPGQTYTFGSTFPGERENEEFIFMREKGFVEEIQCHIFVNKVGEFWIRNAPGSKTFLNQKLIEEPKQLQIGDNVSFKIPQMMEGDFKPGPVFEIKNRELTGPSNPAPISGPELVDDDGSVPFFPLEGNSLIFSNIMDFLTLDELKTCRLVSKAWSVTAIKTLEKRCELSFQFGPFYVRPEVSTLVFRCLAELKEIKIRNLSIAIANTSGEDSNENESDGSSDSREKEIAEKLLYQYPLKTSKGEPGEKMLLDLKKLLNSSQNFLSLQLGAGISNALDFSIFQQILQNLGENLSELYLSVDIKFFPVEDEKVPPLPISWVKTFSHRIVDYDEEENDSTVNAKLAALIVPSLRRMESFSSEEYWAGHYLKQLVETRPQRLCEVTIRRIRREDLPILLRLSNPLRKLTLFKMEPFTTRKDVEVFEKLLLKHATTLEFLSISIHTKFESFVKFPRFPNLKEFKMHYGPKMRIIWDTPDQNLDYSKVFPSLRKLGVKPRRRDFQYNLVFQWDKPEDLFNSFFPIETEQKLDKVELVKLRPLQIRQENVEVTFWDRSQFDETFVTHERFDSFLLRLKKVEEMFPNAFIKGNTAPKEGP